VKTSIPHLYEQISLARYYGVATIKLNHLDLGALLDSARLVHALASNWESVDWHEVSRVNDALMERFEEL
jgi:hypothetical protein